MKTISEKSGEISAPSHNDGDAPRCYETVCSDSKASLSAYSRTDFMNAPVQQAMQGEGFFRRMPCKARGVPGEHVARNAYIDIPLHAKHGTLLSCSHPTCRLSGRRFRFCAVCQVPVAKRNFARRHTHGLSLVEINSSTASDLDVSPVGSTVASYNSMQRGTQSETKLGKMNSVFPPKVVSSSSLSHSIEKKIPGEISVASGNEKSSDTLMTSDMTSVVMSLGDYSANERKSKQNQKTAIYVSEDELDWLYLFRQRPASSESKEAWLKRVEQVGGVSLRSNSNNPKKSLKRPATDDEELSDIEPTGDGLGNFDSSNMEDLFE